MKAGMWVAVAAGIAIGAAPADLFAQGGSQRARAEQRDRQDERARERQEKQRRSAEHDRVRNQRGAHQNARIGVIQSRDSRSAQRNDRRDDRDRYDARDARRNPEYGVMRDQRSRNGGPAFCRSGEGHPVFGRQWCYDKGFGIGNDRNARDSRRDRDIDIWRDVILRQPRDRRYDRTLNRSMLQDVLGAVTMAQFEAYGRQHGNGLLTGRWLDNRGSVLQLQLGGAPIARLVDSNRDGRVDSVQLRR